jgi:hypothetical protein
MTDIISLVAPPYENIGSLQALFLWDTDFYEGKSLEARGIARFISNCFTNTHLQNSK